VSILTVTSRVKKEAASDEMKMTNLKDSEGENFQTIATMP
jgi:hypothetical protein